MFNFFCWVIYHCVVNVNLTNMTHIGYVLWDELDQRGIKTTYVLRSARFFSTISNKKDKNSFVYVLLLFTNFVPNICWKLDANIWRKIVLAFMERGRPWNVLHGGRCRSVRVKRSGEELELDCSEQRANSYNRVNPVVERDNLKPSMQWVNLKRLSILGFGG